MHPDFVQKTFVNCHKTSKFVKVFSLESFYAMFQATVGTSEGEILSEYTTDEFFNSYYVRA